MTSAVKITECLVLIDYNRYFNDWNASRVWFTVLNKAVCLPKLIYLKSEVIWLVWLVSFQQPGLNKVRHSEVSQSQHTNTAQTPKEEREKCGIADIWPLYTCTYIHDYYADLIVLIYIGIFVNRLNTIKQRQSISQACIIHYVSISYN